MHAFVEQLAMLTGVSSNWLSSFAIGGTRLSQTAATTLITAIWQGAVIAVCFSASLRLGKRIPAGLRFALWAGGFLAVLGLPFLPLLVRAKLGSGSLGGAATAHSWLQLDERWSIAIALIWIASSLYRAVDLILHSFRLRRLWTSAVPISHQPVSVPRLWGRKPLEICSSDLLDRPSVIGFFAPRVLIPSWLAPQISNEELEQIVLHEAEHLRRVDDWTNLLQKLSLVIFPLNPALVWIERQLCLEREMACDEAVVRVTRAPKAYAACLTSLAERGLERRLEALSLGTWHRKPELVHRVHSILKRRQLLSPLGARGVVIAMAGSLLFGTVELARCPQLVTFTATATKHTGTSVPLQASNSVAGDMVFRDGPQALPVSATGMGNARMVDLRATMPVRAGVPFRPSKAAPGSSFVAGTPGSGPHTRRQQAKHAASRRAEPMLKADLNDNRPYLTEGSGLVVFTTWEEVVSQSSQDPSYADLSTYGQASQIASETTASPAHAPDATKQRQSAAPDQEPGRVAVTQFVFRVVPATYRSSSQAIVPFRDGWLVIQL